MSAPFNSRYENGKRVYGFRGKTARSVTTILDAIAKPALLTWYAKVAAGAALDVIREEKTTKDVLARFAEEQLAAHEATKTHQERHKNKCDFAPDALNWLATAPTRNRDTAGARGTAVHVAAEIDADLSMVPENAKKAYGSYMRWLEDYQPTILVKEGQVWSDEGPYAGSFDLIAEVSDRLYLIDLKTSKSIYHTMRLQLAAYRYADSVIYGDAIDVYATEALDRVEAAAILHLTDDGYDFIEVEAGPNEYRDFLNTIQLDRFLLDTDRTPVGVTIAPPQAAAA